MSGTNTRPLTAAQIERLHADLRRRDALMRQRAEHSVVVLELDLGVSNVTIWKIDTGNLADCPRGGTAPDTIQEVKRRRAIWHDANQQLQTYTKAAMQLRHQISEPTLIRHIQAVRAGRVQEAA